MLVRVQLRDFGFRTKAGELQKSPNASRELPQVTQAPFDLSLFAVTVA
jgi:hypothetical protein